MALLDWSSARWRSSLVRAVLCVLAAGMLLPFALPDQAQAIPAFARKYNVTCTACHTAPPILNQYGQRFLENGYQLPGTEDGGITGKKTLGDLSLDDITNYLALRLFGNVVTHWWMERPHTPQGIQSNTELTFPQTFTLFTAGTASKNVGFMVELGYDNAGGSVDVERGFVTLNNIGSHLGYRDLLHIRAGKFDPSAFSSYPSVRRQLNGIGERFAGGCGAFTPCLVTRAGLAPSAFATKFYGLYDRDGTYLSPFETSLYHSGAETGIDIHGRPFGDWLLYQIGILNGTNEPMGDSNKGKDIYGMVRLDYARSQSFSANISGFIYHGNSNAKVQTQEDVHWHRWGVSARATYKMIDVHAAYAIDKINKTPASLSGLFDSTATGFTVAADAYVTNRMVLTVQYDNLDAGGMVNQRKSSTFIGLQAKYFLRQNVAMYVRDDFNLRSSEGGTTGARNLRNGFFAGVDIIF